jgi:hypothetical protein
MADPEAAYAALQASLAPPPSLSPKQARLLALLDQERDNQLSIALLNAYNGPPNKSREEKTPKLNATHSPAPSRPHLGAPDPGRPLRRDQRLASRPRPPRRPRLHHPRRAHRRPRPRRGPRRLGGRRGRSSSSSSSSSARARRGAGRA